MLFYFFFLILRLFTKRTTVAYAASSALSSHTKPAYSLGRRPSSRSRTSACSYIQPYLTIVCRFGGLHLRNLCKYIDCYSILIYQHRRDKRLSWHNWLTHNGQLTHRVVTCRPQIGHKAGKVRRPETDIHELLYSADCLLSVYYHYSRLVASRNLPACC